jgi:hypothetical protein
MIVGKLKLWCSDCGLPKVSNDRGTQLCMCALSKTEEDVYPLTEAEICYILNEILGSYWILFPFNPRLKAQKKFIDLAKALADKGE